jgi:dolichol-phosphate mannosyltransferase
MKLSIIIPVFNEEKTIVKSLDRVRQVNLGKIKKEIIVVDDGSTDETAAVIKKYKDKGILFLTHDKNAGKGAAVRTGISKASGDYILIQDADLEYDPKFIPLLLFPIEQNQAKVVYGTRLNRMPNIFKEESNLLFLLHYFGNRFLSLITSMLYGQWITDMETGYKVFPKAAVGSMRLKSRGFDFEPEITANLLKKGYKILEVPIATVPRGYEEGKKLNTVRDGLIAVWTLFKCRVN